MHDYQGVRNFLSSAQRGIDSSFRSVQDAILGPKPAPRSTVPERWPTRDIQPETDKLETSQPNPKAPDAAAPSPAPSPAPTPTRAPAASSAKTGVNLRSAPAKRASPGETCGDLTTKFVRDHQAELSGEMTPQTRDKLAKELSKLPGFARMQDEMASPRNKAAVARGVDWNAGTTEGRRSIGRNFSAVVQQAPVQPRAN